MDYQDLNDYELIYYVGENIEEASDILYDKYQPLVRGIASKMHKFIQNTGLEFSDLMQEGGLALTSAIRSYEPDKDICFYTYARTCIEKKIISIIIKARRKKNKILNESVSYDTFTNAQYSVLADTNSNPLDIVIASNNEDNLQNLLKEELTEFELNVLKLKLSNFSYQEIADMLDKDKKSIDNAVQRIRLKAREVLKKIANE